MFRYLYMKSAGHAETQKRNRKLAMKCANTSEGAKAAKVNTKEAKVTDMNKWREKLNRKRR